MATVEEVREAALRLLPGEQLQLIRELLRHFEQSYQQRADSIPPGIRRTAPVTSIAELAADFGRRMRRPTTSTTTSPSNAPPFGRATCERRFAQYKHRLLHLQARLAGGAQASNPWRIQ